MGRPGGEHSLLLTAEFRWFDFTLLVIVVLKSYVEDKDDPYVTKAIETLQTRRIYLIYKCHSRSGIFDKAALTWSTKFLSEAGLKESNWFDIICSLLFIVIETG